MSKISFVYFDVGGVAIKDFSDTNKWNIMIDKAMGIPKDHWEAFDDLYDKYEDDICLGKIAVDELQPYIKEHFKANIPPNFSMLNYFLDHFEENSELWSIVDTHLNDVKIGLLTDQYLGMLDGIFAKKLIPELLWSSIIDSSVVGVRKPMDEIYQIAADRSGVSEQEILFIDNRDKNLIPAKRRGWQTFLYNSSDYDQANKDLANFISQNL